MILDIICQNCKQLFLLNVTVLYLVWTNSSNVLYYILEIK